MQKIITLCFFLSSLTSFSQVYPFKEGFTTSPSGAVPAGWGGDVKVLLNHGTNNGKGLAADLNSIFADREAITPVVGPLTAQSTVSFFYRVVDQYIYPSTPTTFYDGDTIDVQVSTDGINYNTVYEINSTDHHPSLGFAWRKAYLSGLTGDTVHVKFKMHFGGTGGGYYVDIDSVAIMDDPNAAINNIENNIAVKLFPNPVTANNTLSIALDAEGESQYAMYSCLGQLVQSGSFIKSAVLSTTYLTNGTYYIKVSNQVKTVVLKLLVE